MIYRITLIGNPNTGKTTLLNTLTKSSEKASNWHGVTVCEKTKKVIYKNDEFIFTDLPGIYSLESYDAEEIVAAQYLEKNKNDLVINICDANNLKRNLKLTTELIKRNYKVLLIINMANEITPCDYKKLSNEIGCLVLSIDARNKKIKTEIFNNIKNYALNKKLQNNNKKTVIYNDLIKKDDIFYNIKPYKLSDKIDKIVLNKVIFIPLFLFIMFMVFYFTFGEIGVFITDFINNCFNKIAKFLYFGINSFNFSPFITNLLCEGVVDSIFSLLSFLPQIVMLMFFLNLLEDSGIMSRFAFMLDGIMKKVGLTGKSLFSLFMGYGCTTSAIITTKNLESDNLKKKTISLLPYVPCTAKLPIFLTISSLFFDRYKYLFVFGIYLLSIVIMFFVALINKNIDEEKYNFIIEMPKYRVPNLSKIIKDILVTIKDFLCKMTKVVLFFSVIVWILRNLSPRLIYLSGENFDKSLLYFLSEKISFLFIPIGLNNAGIVASLFLGFCAKELIVVGLYLITGAEPTLSALSNALLSPNSVCQFSIKSSIIFLIFVAFYSPCVSAIVAAKNEVNKKFAMKWVLVQTGIAYTLALIINLCFSNFNFIYFILALLLVVILSKIMLKLKKQNNLCKGDCNVCRKV